MTIIGKSMFPLQNSIRNITNMKARFDQLQLQLATGKKAADLAEMGSDRYFDLSIRSRLSKIDAYQSNITTTNLRLDVLDQAVSRLDVIESDARGGAVPGNYGSSDVNFETVPTLSRSRLDEVLNLMNVDVAGRYAFGGSKTETRPVQDTASILDGTGGRAGFKAVMGERKLADLGPGGMGRLGVTQLLNAITLAEDGAHPFGIKLSGVSSSSTAITVTQPTGDPASLGVDFTGVPVAGDTVTFTLSLPDGSSETVTLEAVTGTPGPGQFQLGLPAPGATMATQPTVATATGTLTINGENFAITNGDDATVIAGLINANGLVGVTATIGTGADAGKLILTGDTDATAVNITGTVAGLGLAVANHPATTVADTTAPNFRTALEAEIADFAATKLVAASAFAAADNFFNGRGEPVLRVDGPPFATATAYKIADPANTVMWYNGETQYIKAEDLGRLATTVNGSTATLSEFAPVSAAYGFKLTSVTSGLTNVTATLANTSPDNLSVAFHGLPVAGETLSVQLALPQGGSRDVTLRAVAGTPGPGEFRIGAGVAGTTIATQPSVATAGGTLTINGQNFAITNGDDATVVAGLINGNGLVGVTATIGTGANAGRLILTGNTGTTDVNVTASVAGLGIAVANYQATSPETAANFEAALKASLGEAAAAEAGSPRQTLSSRVGDGTVANYGVQANETGILELVRSLAVMASQTYPGADDTSAARFDAIAMRNIQRLSEGHNDTPGSIEVIAVELGMAQSTAATLNEQHVARKGQLDTMLDEIEGVSTEQVAMEILALKTRLEASYQTTSLLSQLSLVNYL